MHLASQRLEQCKQRVLKNVVANCWAGCSEEGFDGVTNVAVVVPPEQPMAVAFRGLPANVMLPLTVISPVPRMCQLREDQILKQSKPFLVLLAEFLHFNFHSESEYILRRYNATPPLGLPRRLEQIELKSRKIC